LASGRRATENRATPSAVPAATSEHIRTGQQMVAAWYHESSPDKLTAARQHFEAALREQPLSVDAHHGLAIVADLQKRYTEAEKHYLQAIAEAPTNSKVLGDLGYSYLLQGRLMEGEQYLNRALAHDPNNQNAVKHLGDVYAEQGKVELATATYRRVLDNAEIEQALAEHGISQPAAQPTGDDRSLFDRLRNRPSEEERLAGDIRQRMEENRLAEQARQRQLAEAAAARQVASMNDPRRENWDDGAMLRQQLASIDQERYRNVPQGPIVLDGSGAAYEQPIGREQFAAGGQRTPGESLAGNDAVWHADGSGGIPRGGRPVENAFFGAGGGNGAESGRNAMRSGPQGMAAQQPRQPDFGPPPTIQPGVRTQADATTEANPVANVDRLTQPWGQTVAPAGVEFPGNQRPGESGVNPAFHRGGQQAPVASAEWANDPRSGQQQTPAPYVNGSGYGESGDAGFGGAVTADATPQGASPLQDASRAAARLGMGFGPGAMFPVFDQAATHAAPGSSTMLNGAAVPPPQRYLPSEAAPVDLREQMAVDMPEQRMMTNQYGQQVPTNDGFRTQPHQLGTASRYEAGGNVRDPLVGNPNMEMYDQQRAQLTRDLNTAVQQAGGQQYQQAPGMDVRQGDTHPGGSVMYDPTSGSQYTFPHAQGVQPPQYPHTARPAASMPAAEMSVPEARSDRQGVVMPESYRSHLQRENGAMPPTMRSPSVGPSQSFGGSDGLPQIVPGG
ncbi:MAG: tetratricopeptide repeat protein, partial [Planctomycetaceae bacterium]|nr:tetratricopeptide repeat protein [Planctomycetaceae bacterium]